MKKKLLKWIERILGIDELKKELEKERELMQKYRNETEFWFENRKEELRHTQDLVKLLKEARIASDIAFDRHRSWAIVCLGGKKELVHFYQFPDRNIKDIHEFLKRFNSDKHHIIVDAPYGIDIHNMF